MIYDVVPDIHGQVDKLKQLLSNLGWKHTGKNWTAPGADHRLVFLGDYIDRGPRNREVLGIVRGLVESGQAHAIMGNHELNALRMHHTSGDGAPYRERSPSKLSQHAAFLGEFYFEPHLTQEWLAWFSTLPLYLDFGDFRVVHACWSEAAITKLTPHVDGGRLPLDVLLESARSDHPLHEAVNLLTKGPEYKLSGKALHRDRRGFERADIRIPWWRGPVDHWREAVIDPAADNDLSEFPLVEAVNRHRYKGSTQVFFGHYVLEKPDDQAHEHCLCLDFCSRPQDPITAYRFKRGDRQLLTTALITSSSKFDR